MVHYRCHWQAAGGRPARKEADSCQLAAWWMTIWIMQRQQRQPRLRQAASVDTIDWMIRLWFATAAAISTDCNWSRQVEGASCSCSGSCSSCSALLMYSNRALSAATHAHTHVQTRTHTHLHTYTPCCAFNLVCSAFFFCSVPISGYYGNKQINSLSPSHCYSPSLSTSAACSSLFICFLCSCFH